MTALLIITQIPGKQRLSWEHQEASHLIFDPQIRASDPPIVQEPWDLERNNLPKVIFKKWNVQDFNAEWAEPRADSLYFLSAQFSISQIVCTNMPFCGCDCRGKGWMFEDNGTVPSTPTSSLCGGFIMSVFSVWNASQGPQTSAGSPSWPLICPLPAGTAWTLEFSSELQASVWIFNLYSQLQGFLSPGRGSLLVFLSHHSCFVPWQPPSSHLYEGASILAPRCSSPPPGPHYLLFR